MKIKIWIAILSDGEARGEVRSAVFNSEQLLRFTLNIDENGYSDGEGMPVIIKSEIIDTDLFEEIS